MNCLGCLLILLIIAGPTIVVLILKLGLNIVTGFLNKLGAIAVWLWESFLNYFRREKKEVFNPINGTTNFDDLRQAADLTYEPTETPEKIYDASDGEYIDYTEI